MTKRSYRERLEYIQERNLRGVARNSPTKPRYVNDRMIAEKLEQIKRQREQEWKV